MNYVTRTLSVYFEGLSKTQIDQSGKIMHFGVLAYTIKIIELGTRQFFCFAGARGDFFGAPERDLTRIMFELTV